MDEREADGLSVAEDWSENANEDAVRIHTAATDLASDRAIELGTVTEVGKPAGAILEYAGDYGVDKFVMGSHGRLGIDRALLGSVAETVTRRAQIPMTIIS